MESALRYGGALLTPPQEPWAKKPLGYRVAKRALDLVGATLGLLLVWPILVTLAIWIKADSEGPVFYRGRRIGRLGREFRIFKFRSMVQNADKIGGPTTSDDDPRVTRPGKVLRKYKLDELAQLLNVLSGDMSLVGPRPDVPSEVTKLTAAERRAILSVRPGMTDWASVRFHNEGEIVAGQPDPHAAYETLIRPEKIRLQADYATRATFWIDVKILWTTATTLVRTRA